MPLEHFCNSVRESTDLTPTKHLVNAMRFTDPSTIPPRIESTLSRLGARGEIGVHVWEACPKAAVSVEGEQGEGLGNSGSSGTFRSNRDAGGTHCANKVLSTDCHVLGHPLVLAQEQRDVMAVVWEVAG